MSWVLTIFLSPANLSSQFLKVERKPYFLRNWGDVTAKAHLKLWCCNQFHWFFQWMFVKIISSLSPIGNETKSLLMLKIHQQLSQAILYIFLIMIFLMKTNVTLFESVSQCTFFHNVSRSFFFFSLCPGKICYCGQDVEWGSFRFKPMLNHESPPVTLCQALSTWHTVVLKWREAFLNK